MTTTAAITAEPLRSIPYFAELEAAALKDLARYIRTRAYRRGETVLLEGEPCPGLYFVVSGRVKVFKTSPEGKEQVLRILGPGRQIAAMTGSVREVVQRALKTLEREGAIEVERARVRVLDPAALERWSESALPG